MLALPDVNVETGKLRTPLGTEYVGFKVTLLGDNPDVARYYSDIERITRAQPEHYKVREERDAAGKFKSFTVETV